MKGIAKRYWEKYRKSWPVKIVLGILIGVLTLIIYAEVFNREDSELDGIEKNIVDEEEDNADKVITYIKPAEIESCRETKYNAKGHACGSLTGMKLYWGEPKNEDCIDLSSHNTGNGMQCYRSKIAPKLSNRTFNTEHVTLCFKKKRGSGLSKISYSTSEMSLADAHTIIDRLIDEEGHEAGPKSWIWKSGFADDQPFQMETTRLQQKPNGYLEITSSIQWRNFYIGEGIKLKDLTTFNMKWGEKKAKHTKYLLLETHLKGLREDLCGHTSRNDIKEGKKFIHKNEKVQFYYNCKTDIFEELNIWIPEKEIYENCDRLKKIIQREPLEKTTKSCEWVFKPLKGKRKSLYKKQVLTIDIPDGKKNAMLKAMVEYY